MPAGPVEARDVLADDGRSAQQLIRVRAGCGQQRMRAVLCAVHVVTLAPGLGDVAQDPALPHEAHIRLGRRSEAVDHGEAGGIVRLPRAVR